MRFELWIRIGMGEVGTCGIGPRPGPPIPRSGVPETWTSRTWSSMATR